MKKTTLLSILGCICFLVMSANLQAQTVVTTLADFQAAVKNSNQTIAMTPGTYQLTDLPSTSRVIDCSGSNNTIILTGVTIKALVGSIRETYFIVSGSNNILRDGKIEDYYKSGRSDDITDYSAYNNDPDLAYGLKGAAVMTVYGNYNQVIGLELIVRGSDPYGYGSIYGIGSDHTFSINKRCGLLITGINGGGQGNTLDGITMHHNAFGHGIYIQEGASGSLIKNCYVEGRMRLSAELYNEKNSYDLPFLSNYQIAAEGTDYSMPFASPVAIPLDVMYPLSEDGIRAYSGIGSVTVENCTVKQMRGGIRLYLASSATVTNSKAIDCGETNFNMPANSIITGSSGNFTFAPLNDFRLSKSNQNVELTIIPSPNDTGPHNIADISGSNHKIVFHRTAGPKEITSRAIVVTGSNSTITNETEYDIVLASTSSGNTINSCGGGKVTDNGTNNTILTYANCADINSSVLNVGDTFTDGNFNFKVTSVAPNQVSITGASTVISGAIALPSTGTDAVTATTYSVTDIGLNAFFNANGVGMTSVTVPTGVLTIQNQAFRATKITTISLPNTVTYLGENNFRDTPLTALVIPNSVTSVGNSLLYNAKSVASLTLSNQLTKLQNRWFYSANALTKVTIPASVTVFEMSSFLSAKITTLYMESSTPPVIDPYVDATLPGWGGNPANITAYVPSASVATYKAANIWKDMTILDIATLGVKSQEMAIARVYPNPTTGVLFVQTGQQTDAVLTVVDLTGKTLLSGKGNQIDISNLGKGVYILKVKTEKGVFAERIIKK